MTFDGIVLGAGAAGMVAALRAADQGARVALVDPHGARASNLVASSGLFSAAGTRFQQANGTEDGPAQWSRDIHEKAGGAVDPVIVDRVTARSADLAHFFADRLGFAVRHLPGLDIPGHSAPRLHEAHPEGGAGLAALLFGAVARTPSITVVAADASGLITEPGAEPGGARVIGADTSQGPLHAGWTLLASGGFGAQAGMLARHVPEIAGAVYIGVGPNDGRAHHWGSRLGGTLAFMDSYQGQGHTIPDGLGRLGPGLTSFGAMLVNARGERFADESMGPSEFGAFVLAQPGGTAIEIFDGRIHEEGRQLSTYRACLARGVVVERVDEAGLAAAFRLPPEALHRSLLDYAAIVAGAPDPHGRRVALRPLVPPYYAARVTGALAHTQGGLLIDGRARVRRGGGVVPGLLAAGAAAAGISGHGAAGYLPGNGLGHAFTLGLVAGETIAGGAPARDVLPSAGTRSL